MSRLQAWGRALLVMAFGFVLASPLLMLVPPPPATPLQDRVEAEPVPLNPEQPGARDIGPLRYLGGWSLRSASRWFGGVSAMSVGPDRVLATSDGGILLRFDRPDRSGDALTVFPLRNVPGTAKLDRDTEALATDGTRLWIAFERRNQIWRYAADGLRPEQRSAPEGMRRWPANSGAEALARLADGRFLLIAENRSRDGTSPALLFLGDPADPATGTVPLRIRPPAGHLVTDATALPDGRLLVLTRRFSAQDYFTAKLLVAELPAIAPDAQIRTREVAAFEAPLTKDNFEAVAVTVEDGRTIVWLASDDNYLPVQRTLLLKFEWAG